MIKSFYRYICYSIYKIAANSSTHSGKVNRSSAYYSFLLLVSFIPAIILMINIKQLPFFNFMREIPERSYLNIFLYLIFFFAPPMVIISLLIKKSYLESLTLPNEEIRKNKRVFWLLILVFILYLVMKILIARSVIVI